jgi:hypothetical protein
VPARTLGVADRQDPAAGAIADPSRVARRRAATAGRRLAPVALGVTLLVVAPLVVGLVVLAEPRWFPVLDMAQTELRLRDVPTRHIPLIGLAGRIGPLGDQGSHPGPLSFWMLWTPYQLFGASAWAMLGAAASLHTLAVAGCLWVAARRRGLALVLGLGLVLALLLRAYTAHVLLEPWNPYMPVTWWVLFLLAVWSVLDGDAPMLPVAVVAGSFCAQTHVPYVGPVAGVSALAVAVVAWRAWRRPDPDRAARRRLARGSLVAAGLAVALWTAPVVDELGSDRGNLSRLADHFASPPEESIGLRRGVDLLLAHLNPWRILDVDLVSSRFARPSVLPGLAVLAAWAVAVALAWRLRSALLLRLHLVLGAALVLTGITMSRIFGYVWFYLSFYAWGLTALVVLATAWTYLEAWAARRRAREVPVPRRGVRAGGIALVAGMAASAVAFGLAARDTTLTDARESRQLGEVVPGTLAALERPGAVGGGKDGRYFVDFTIDPIAIGSQGFGLVNELERAGYDVGLPELHWAGGTRHRVLDPEDATGVIHLAVGDAIADLEGRPELEEVARSDTRSPAERAEFERLGRDLEAELEADGLPDLARDVDRLLFSVALDPRLDEGAHPKALRMMELGLPIAVFLGPPEPAS